MDYEARVEKLGLEVPDFSAKPYYGPNYGSMKSHHLVGPLLYLSGHTPELPDGTILHPGHLGREVTVDQGYEAARLTGLNCLAGIRFAVGSLNRVKSIVSSLNFVACTPDFYDVNKISSGATDLFHEVFGDEAGLGGRATIGIRSLCPNACFETWLTVEVSE